MKAQVLRAACLAALIAVSVPGWTQAKPVALVEFASGDDFIVIRGGRKVPFQDPIGLELYQGDQLQTGDGVFVELSLAAGNAVLKLAENTTFILDKVSDGQTSLQLVYGRVRAKVAKVAGTESFTVRSAQAIAGVRGTDFGVDVVASRVAAASATSTRAYCFEGAVEVTAFVRSDALAAESLEPIPKSFVIGAGEMLKVEGVAGKSEASKAPLEQSIRSFWESNDYQSMPQPTEAAAPSLPAPSAEELAAARDKELRDAGYAAGFAAARAEFYKGPDWVPEGFVPEEELKAIADKARKQKAALIAGGVLGFAGSAMSLSGLLMGDSGTVLMTSGAVVGACAIPFVAVALLIGP